MALNMIYICLFVCILMFRRVKSLQWYGMIRWWYDLCFGLFVYCPVQAIFLVTTWCSGNPKPPRPCCVPNPDHFWSSSRATLLFGSRSWAGVTCTRSHIPGMVTLKEIIPSEPRLFPAWSNTNLHRHLITSLIDFNQVHFNLSRPFPEISRYRILRCALSISFFWGHNGTVQLVQGYPNHWAIQP